MEILNTILPFLNLGMAGLLIGLLIGRVLITKKEMNEAEKRHESHYEKRLSEKDGQIQLLQIAVKEDAVWRERIASVWESAIGVIIKQREEIKRNGNTR